MNAPRERIVQFGPISPTSKPDELLCAGPWVFAGQETLFPDWEKRFAFAPEPLEKVSDLVSAGHKAICLTGEYLPRLAAQLSSQAQSYPDCYWETLLVPWAGLVAQQIVERWLRIKVLIQDFREEALQLPLLPDDLVFDFVDENDLTLHGVLGRTFNHWLFSWLLRRSQLPKAWRITEAQSYAETRPARSPSTLRQKLRAKIAKTLLLLPFPRLKGLSLWQSLRFSLALAHPSQGPDHSRSLSQLCASLAENTQDLPADLLPVFLKALPRSLKDLGHPGRIPHARQSKLFVASISAYEDSQYRQRLACLRAQGHRLMFIQHGGNYGQIKSPCLTRMFEFQQHIFGTWGWKHYEDIDGHFLPLPYPQLQRIANQHTEKAAELVFVGTEMPLYGYRLDCRPNPMATLNYRRAKEHFFSALDQKLLASSLYRPYFPLPSSLADADWLLPRFPGLRLCTGPLWPKIRHCRLLVLDHHGTTLLEAMAANIPVLVTFALKDWPLTQQCLDIFQRLEEVGLFFRDARLCAAQASRIWQNLPTWWQSDSIQKVRQAFCQEFALTISGNETPYLITQLKTL
ncbi:MAG: LIC12162 family protein [Desulfovibrio sp.]|nr:LIC12162 family protein [Desulfovibrio sp.]